MMLITTASIPWALGPKNWAKYATCATSFNFPLALWWRRLVIATSQTRPFGLQLTHIPKFTGLERRGARRSHPHPHPSHTCTQPSGSPPSHVVRGSQTCLGSSWIWTGPKCQPSNPCPNQAVKSKNILGSGRGWYSLLSKGKGPSVPTRGREPLTEAASNGHEGKGSKRDGEPSGWPQGQLFPRPLCSVCSLATFTLWLAPSSPVWW